MGSRAGSTMLRAKRSCQGEVCKGVGPAHGCCPWLLLFLRTSDGPLFSVPETQCMSAKGQTLGGGHGPGS